MNKISLKDFIAKQDAQKRATNFGTDAHKKLQHIVIAPDAEHGDTVAIAEIKKHPEIAALFGTDTRTEVPIAGYINGKFISRRIDRLIIRDNEIIFVDYKTDTDRTTNRDKYEYQMREYETLLRAAFPAHTITGYIIWLHDWELEKIV